MRQIMLIINLILFVFLTWNCDDKIILEPEKQVQEENLDKQLSVATVTPILSLDPGNSPEGIAIDWRGNIYISNTIGEDRSNNEILRIHSNGTHSLYATLPGAGHARGLTTDWKGNLFVAFATKDPSTHGVYKIGHNKLPVRLRGSEEIKSPNALVFDWRGNLYVTDSYDVTNNFEGAIWKSKKARGKLKLWLQNPLLNGGFAHPPGPPEELLPGANGIAFYPPNKLYIANTRESSVLCAKIGRNGKPASINLVKSDFLLMNIDGIAVDIHENIYGVLPPSTIAMFPPDDLELPPLVKLNPRSGEITQIVTFEDRDLFDTPTSLAFGRGWGNWGSIYIANAALIYGQPPLAGPGVVKVKVGVFGLSKK